MQAGRQAGRRKLWGSRVLRLWEAFLLQMNDFDKFLELKLRQMLDPVVASSPPARRGRLGRPRKPILAVEPATIQLPAESIPAVEPIAVTIPVAAHQL